MLAIIAAMRLEAAIIGGTGIGARLAELGGTPVFVPTPHGTVRLTETEFGGKRVGLLSRHAAGHKVPPHRVRYLAMASALRTLGSPVCLATAAVGSLRNDWPMGTLAVCSDFLDLTGRRQTRFDREVVHTDFSEPFSDVARCALLEGARAAGVAVQPEGVYVNGDGPRYETPFEIRWYRSFGGDVVGMTAASEAIAMREAGVPYGCLAVITNLAAGLAGAALSHSEVEDGMRRASDKVLALLEAAVRAIP